MIRRDELDLLTEHLAAEVVNRHLRRGNRALSADVRVQARHVGEHADPDHVARDFLLLSPRARQRGQSTCHQSYQPLLVHLRSPCFLFNSRTAVQTPRYSCSMSVRAASSSLLTVSTTRPRSTT